MENGTINQFVKSDRDANRIDLVGRLIVLANTKAHWASTQLADVVCGLMCMHKLQVVHGDLKGVRNRGVGCFSRDIMVPTGKRPGKQRSSRLSRRLRSLRHHQCGHSPGSCPLSCEQEGLSDVHHPRWKLSVDESGTSGPRRARARTDEGVGYLRPRYAYLRGSYTRLVANVTRNSKGMNQVLCGSIPFRDLTNSSMIVLEISKGTRPEKPEDVASFGFTGKLWEIVERCWSADKDARPTLEAVLSCLRGASSKWRVAG